MPSDSATASRATLLVVEDSDVNRELLVRRLRRRGFTVLEAADAHVGLILARREAPGLILMDMGLPEIDGLAATRALKADEATRGIPIVAVTAHAFHEAEQSAFDAGCAAFASKPVEFDRLLLTIESLLAPPTP